jgi:hypothetical protein
MYESLYITCKDVSSMECTRLGYQSELFYFVMVTAFAKRLVRMVLHTIIQII